MRLLLLTTCFSIFVSMISQAQMNFFTPHEIDSIDCFYFPMNAIDSVKISDLEEFDYLNVFFFNGECSLCLVKMKTVEDFFRNYSNESVKTLFISETSDTIILNFYRDKYNIDVPIIWDNKRRIREKKITNEDSICFLIDQNGNIILSGDFLADEALKEKYIPWMDVH